MKICHHCLKKNPGVSIKDIALKLVFVKEYHLRVPYYDCPKCGERFSVDHCRGSLFEYGYKNRWD